MPTDKKRGGFTLIELLVVIVIIAILSACILAVFTSVRENGRRTACLSNERQVGLAILQYASDDDEKLPCGTQPWPETGNPVLKGVSGIGWAGQIYPYVKNASVFKCPDDPTQSSGPGNYVVSYGINRDFTNPVFSDFSAYKPQNNGSDTIVLFEICGDTADVALPDEGASQGAKVFSASGDGMEWGLYKGVDWTIEMRALSYATGNVDKGLPEPGPQAQLGSPPRHGSGSNYFLLDGHVKWIKPADVCQVHPHTIPYTDCDAHF